MPAVCKHCLLYLSFFTLSAIWVFIPATYPNEGIDTYYIKYDVKSSKNAVVDDNLLMVPSKNDFRAEKFSQISVLGVISASPGEPNETIQKRIKENALKNILVKNGLKSVKTKDYDTVISYEGIILTPLTLIKNTYIEEQNKYMYEVKVDFCPIAFPDRWETMNMKYKIKEMVYGFFQLFK
nr:hypothetical protein [Desulfobacula sp.]